MKHLKIGFVGASHLAYVSAIASAEKGNGNWKVTCFAKSHNFDQFQEPELHELFAKNKQHITFTAHVDDLKNCELVYLAIDVPTDDKGCSDLTPITEYIDYIAPNLDNQAVLVILSQVPPGFTAKVDFSKNRLFYQVETLIFGKAIDRALHPERYIVGALEKQGSLPIVYRQYLEAFNCHIFIMNYQSAELAKISINLYLTATVTTTNMLSEVCEKVGAEWDDIAQTLKLDKRIGPCAYLKPGLGIAGGNLERDMQTIRDIAFEHGAFVKILDAEIADSSYRSNWALRMFKKLESSFAQLIKLGILGLTYKENTNSLKNSAGVKFLDSIGSNLKTLVFDPTVQNGESGQSVVDNSNVLAIMTPWDEFKELDYSRFQGIILDPYGMVKKSPINAKIYTLGKN